MHIDAVKIGEELRGLQGGVIDTSSLIYLEKIQMLETAADFFQFLLPTGSFFWPVRGGGLRMIIPSCSCSLLCCKKNWMLRGTVRHMPACVQRPVTVLLSGRPGRRFFPCMFGKTGQLVSPRLYSFPCLYSLC